MSRYLVKMQLELAVEVECESRDKAFETAIVESILPEKRITDIKFYYVQDLDAPVAK